MLELRVFWRKVWDGLRKLDDNESLAGSLSSGLCPCARPEASDNTVTCPFASHTFQVLAWFVARMSMHTRVLSLIVFIILYFAEMHWLCRSARGARLGVRLKLTKRLSAWHRQIWVGWCGKECNCDQRSCKGIATCAHTQSSLRPLPVEVKAS